MTHNVYYKKPRGFFWHRIKKVKGDTIYEDRQGRPQPVRVIICEDETRYEIPMNYLIKFPKERHYSIQKDVEREAGQKLPTGG